MKDEDARAAAYCSICPLGTVISSTVPSGLQHSGMSLKITLPIISLPIA